MNVTHVPVFTINLLHPKYWLIWLGIIILYIFVVLLPYPIIYYCGIRLGRLVMYFMKYRVNIIRRNLQLCFPNLTIKEKEILLKKNCESIGMGLLETGMAWFWPNWRIKYWCKLNGFNNIIKAHKNYNGILLIGMHFLTLELGARAFGIFNPGIGVYRPNNNPVLNWLQTWGRLRSNKSMIHRKNLKSILRALKNGETVWYAPDHDYGSKNSVFTQLFGVTHTATTIGTYILIKLTQPAIIPFIPRRLPNGLGYELIILPIENTVPVTDRLATISYINKIIEKAILLAPEQYMWLHRRFKTRPTGKSSFY
ncbi:LpxL/LpxP family Kdo(2)-lipid IV(A) lauroyl/palmitoleoyl acyltransferase [Blochmannia endosymbiont of Camponotus (Colobopsis) obliquus]|uniref:LpxL/LpxP family Kdo(2)-lipid IV(A) lauroyl/palmitoleoyl acyltransferase n=1 Tax=Blochmannia endosymbiont of Camponotus (Colobopsis) obliquus TaxID=1505597 RepID=UPI00061A63AA|nr:LpxL/LpxP family Kdo(2)-lipid IV(A) lauroyl/palmitoleoyl acyltransferase [Blochmannia endosymbiont of Camponotus (Colobopsis) obliquus]AKC60570.1 lipid A biosynthesis lauroyl acyltransferase [Blochmannia endosymbiont of Camponotus (Colobopsis) obliquus]